MAASFLSAAPAMTNCNCQNCACTQERHCGCFSRSGCQCSSQACQCGRIVNVVIVVLVEVIVAAIKFIKNCIYY